MGDWRQEGTDDQGQPIRTVGTRYNVRHNKIPIVLDVHDEASSDNHLGNATEFSFNFAEPVNLPPGDSEIYLDQFLTYNSVISNTMDNSAFLLTINEWPHRAQSASTSHDANINSSLMIPNEHKSIANNHSLVIHKGKKLNYVCQINHGDWNGASLSGKITNLAGNPAFHDNTTTGRYTYALTGIDSGNLSRLLTQAESFTEITSNSGTQTVSGTFLVTHFKNSTTIHFSTSAELTNVADVVAGQGSITFNTTATNPVVTNTSGLNPNLTLITNPGRFIAEFVIIQK